MTELAKAGDGENGSRPDEFVSVLPQSHAIGV